MFYVSHVFFVSVFEVIASLSDVRHFKYVAHEFLYPTLIMLLFVTFRFRFSAIMCSFGAPERYSHICVLVLLRLNLNVTVSVRVVVSVL